MFAEDRVIRVAELLSHEPYLAELHGGKVGNDALMLCGTVLAQFAHLAEDDHFVFCLHLSFVADTRTWRGLFLV